MAVLLMLAGCSQEPVTWQEPPAYVYTLDSQCGEQALIGRYRIAVANGKVTRKEGLDETSRRLLTELKSDFIPTLGQLVDRLNTARENDADTADITTDPADGHPTKITLDDSSRAVDDESCFTITDYVVVG